MACPRLSTCPLFQVFNHKATLGVWKVFYCEDRFQKCQRWLLRERGDPVPPNMLPNGRLLEVAHLDAKV